VPKSTTAHAIRQQEKLREQWTLCYRQQQNSQKLKCEGKVPDTEEALSQWFSTVTLRGIRVSGPMLNSKSEELAKKLGHKNFKATDGWFSQWKYRYGTKFKKAHDEKGGVAAVIAE
jgi:hypothetical protein